MKRAISSHYPLREKKGSFVALFQKRHHCVTPPVCSDRLRFRFFAICWSRGPCGKRFTCHCFFPTGGQNSGSDMATERTPTKDFYCLLFGGRNKGNFPMPGLTKHFLNMLQIRLFPVRTLCPRACQTRGMSYITMRNLVMSQKVMAVKAEKAFQPLHTVCF